MDERHRSTHRTYPEAVQAAAAHDRTRSRLRAVARRSVVVALAAAALIPVMAAREVDNPDYPAAREFADGMEAAYRSIDAGEASESSYTVDGGGFTGGVFTVDRSGVTADYHLLVGRHGGDCYVIRWVRFEVPFVGRLLPRYECVPGQPALNFSPSGWEAIAVNLSGSDPLVWDGVLPDPVALAPWFFPAVLVLLFVVLQQLVGVSLLFLRPAPVRAVTVARVDR